MTIPLKYQLQKKLVKQIREDERRKAIEEAIKIIDFELKFGKTDSRTNTLFNIREKLEEMKKQ